MILPQIAITIILLILFIKFAGHVSSVRRDMVIDAPNWARSYWHLVPEELRNSLTYGDWQGMIKAHNSQAPVFCKREEILAFPHPIVLSVTTSPKRIKWLSTVLNCLDLQHVHEIAVNLPTRFGRDQSTYSVIPDHVVNYPKLKIYWHDKDDGPLMKIINTIERAQDPEQICISIDDDICLARNTITSVISASIAYKGQCVIGGRGTQVKRYLGMRNMQSQANLYTNLWPPNKPIVKAREGFFFMDMAEGFGSVAYRAKHLNPERLRAFAASNKKCYTSDDITINTQLQESGITRMRVANVYLWPFRFGKQEDALHVMQSHTHSYGVCIDNMKHVINE